jgi:hypothetical protein
LSEVPENLLICTRVPLFDLVLIENYIIPILHILIGVGNALVNAVLEFVDEWIERLPEQLVVAQNNINTTEINLVKSTGPFGSKLKKNYLSS